MTTEEEISWWVKRKGTPYGPFSQKQINNLLLGNYLEGTDLVSYMGDGWEPISQYPQLISIEYLRSKYKSWIPIPS